MSAEEVARQHVRLSVNLSEGTAAALRELTNAKGLSLTEGINRAIKVWQFAEEQIASGNQLAIVLPDGNVREVVLL